MDVEIKIIFVTAVYLNERIKQIQIYHDPTKEQGNGGIKHNICS